MANWKIKTDVERTVNILAECRMIKSFYPTYISKEAGHPLFDVFNILMSYVEDGRLSIEWEIRCEQYECGRTIKKFDILPDCQEYVTCVCGKEEEITIDNTYPVFSFNSEYREEILRQRKISIKKIKKNIVSSYAKNNKACSLSDMISAINLPSDVSNLSPGSVINYINAQNVNLNGQGGSNMRDSYTISGNSIDANNSNVNLGVNNKIEDYQINKIDNAIQDLLNQVAELEKINGCQYSELKENINSLVVHLKQDKKDKKYIDYLKSGIGKFVNGLKNAATVVSSYEVLCGVIAGI